MDETKFWNIIESAGRDVNGNVDLIAKAVGVRLIKETPAEIQEFDRFLCEKLDAAYSHELWGAAYLIRGGCSDDGFEYFRAWLISRGRISFEAAVADPDSLAAVVTPDPDPLQFECEALLYTAWRAYKEVAGTEMPQGAKRKPILRGVAWDFDDSDETAKRLPQLSSSI
jgi:uncharacterized protein DUF4240